MINITYEEDFVVKQFDTRRLAVDTMTALLGYVPKCEKSFVNGKWLVGYQTEIAVIETTDYSLIKTELLEQTL